MPHPPQHYIKTMCLTIPQDAAVIQASHHGLQAVAGLVAQLSAGQSLQVQRAIRAADRYSLQAGRPSGWSNRSAKSCGLVCACVRSLQLSC